MKLFLIRHGETVDNVAQLYAGIRDSALTNHGVLQTDRLGQYLAKCGLRFTHLFSSDLERAYKTAEAIRLAQASLDQKRTDGRLRVKQLKSLREQDFGSYEGKPFYARPSGSNKTGRDSHREEHHHEPGFQDVESKESMARRADEFVHGHLLPLICQPEEVTVAVASHGIILNYLWRSILKLFAQRTVTIAPGVTVGGASASTFLEYLGGWSNTGYLELDIQPGRSRPGHAVSESNARSNLEDTKIVSPDIVSPLPELRMVVKAINSKEHLAGLKRTRGVSSGKHDERQKKIDGFFKKSKVE